MKRAVLGLLSLSCLVGGTVVLAATGAAGGSGATGGIAGVAENFIGNLGAVAKLITAASYVAGMAFAVGAVVKFKAHKDNPTQIPIGTPIALLFVGAALIFIPTVFKVTGTTLFGAEGQVAGVSGVASFGGTN